MNEFESDWISLSQNQSGGRVFLSESAGKNRCLIPTWQKLNPRWQNSWLQNSWWPPSSSWVRMNEFESDWISLSQNQSGGRVFLSKSGRKIQGVSIPWCRNWIQDSRIQEGQIQDGHHHQVESEWMSEVFLFKWWGGKCEWSFFYANGGNQSWQVWVCLRGKTKMADSKMAKLEMAEFKMAAIIKLSENEWVWVSLN